MDRERTTRPQLTAVASASPTDRGAGARLPQCLDDVRHKAGKRLLVLLARMFDQADDALFELADRAGSNHEQNLYFESMRELRLRRRGIEVSFGQHYEAGFDALLPETEASALAVDGTQRNGKEQQTESLSLVDESEIEEMVAVEGMVSRTLHGSSDELALLSLRFESLLQGVRLDNENNPLAPLSVCRAFTRSYTALNIEIKARLFILKLFEKYVLRELGNIYRSLNCELAEEGVLTNISLADQARRGTPSSAAGKPRQRQSMGGFADGGGLGAEKDGIFSQLQGMLQNAVRVGAAARNAFTTDGSGTVKIVRRSMVIDALRTVQPSEPSLATDESGYVAQLPPVQDLRETVEHLLNEQGGEGRYELGREDEDAINIVGLLFRFLVDDSNLAVPIRSHLSLLQVPIAKVALQDKSFFGKNSHPARKLLNTMAQAALGWEPHGNASRDFLYRKMTQSVKTVLSRYDKDMGVFQEVLSDFTAFLENERRRASVVEQRTLEAEKGRARSEAARLGVAEAIKHCTEGKYLPAVVAELLDHAWSKVLFLIYVREGESSESWKSAVQVMEELVWSVQSKAGDAERQRLSRLMPHLLKSVRVGLSRVGFSYFAMNHFFEQLAVIHRCVLEPASRPSAADLAADDQRATGGDPVASEAAAESGTTLDALLSSDQVSSDQANAQPASADCESPSMSDRVAWGTADQAGPVLESAPDRELPPLDPEIVAMVDTMAIGSWVQFNQAEGIHYRCRLAAVLKPVGFYIFVNRSGKKVAQWSRDQLTRNIASQAVELLDDRFLFDRALESIITQLQGKRD